MTHTIKKIVTGISLACAGHALYFFAPAFVASLILAAIPVLIFIFEWPKLLNALCEKHPRLAPDIVTALYLILPFFCIIQLNQGQPRWLLLLFFYMVFMNDTGGYVIGSLFGKHKLSHVSPNKSWEGVFGGWLFSAITTSVFLKIVHVSLPATTFFLFTLVITVSSVIGDLFESYLKRLAGLKDSGSWLPGHGGLLDRFDSCIPSSVLFYVFVYAGIFAYAR